MNRIRKAFASALAAAGVLAFVLASALHAQIVPQGQSPANPWSIQTTTGHVLSGGGPVSVGACGTNPIFSGSDVAGSVIPGATATQCVVTFLVAYRVAPNCSVDGSNNTPSYIVSATTLTLTVALPGTLYSWLCVGQPGG